MRLIGLTESVGKRIDRDQDQLLLNERDITPGKKDFPSERKLKGTGVSIRMANGLKSGTLRLKEWNS